MQHLCLEWLLSHFSVLRKMSGLDCCCFCRSCHFCRTQTSCCFFSGTCISCQPSCNPL